MLAPRHAYAPSVAMVHLYAWSYGNMHQPIRARHTLVAKELDGPSAQVGKLGFQARRGNARPRILEDARYGYAPLIDMIHIYISSYGNMHQSIGASHTLMAKELGGLECLYTRALTNRMIRTEPVISQSGSTEPGSPLSRFKL